MNKVYCMILMVSLLVVPYAYAQMGGGMMGGQGSQGHMEGMMQGHEVTGGMMHQMGQMSRLMQQVRDMMAEKSDAESMRKMSGLMQDMSQHLKDMSNIMKEGNASQEEMQELNQQNMMMQKKYEMMRW
jgi:hypothetical protein